VRQVESLTVWFVPESVVPHFSFQPPFTCVSVILLTTFTACSQISLDSLLSDILFLSEFSPLCIVLLSFVQHNPNFLPLSLSLVNLYFSYLALALEPFNIASEWLWLKTELDGKPSKFIMSAPGRNQEKQRNSLEFT